MLSAAMTIIIALVLLHFLPAAVDDEEAGKTYNRYYMMITEEDSSLWRSIYEGICTRSEADQVCTDYLNDDMDSTYTVEDRMRVAIASSVDGIILNASENETMTDLINEAADEGIPVVTLYTDHTQSRRCSFVGIGSYNLGKEYGSKALELIQAGTGRETKAAGDSAPASVNVMVLASSRVQSLDQNILYAGIQETIDQGKTADVQVNFELKAIDDTSAFSAEEAIRDIFLQDNLPDIMICLNEQNTTCAYQAVVDYDRVGEVSILGYYDSETILNAIERGTLDATVSIDTAQMGRYCIDALEEYYELGNTSEYFTADITMIDQDNVASYLEEGADEENE